MKLDFNETNILAVTLSELEKSTKTSITRAKILDSLYALGVYTDKKYGILRASVKSLMMKLEKLSDDDILRILEDSKNENIITSVCYQLPQTDNPKHNN